MEGGDQGVALEPYMLEEGLNRIEEGSNPAEIRIDIRSSSLDLAQTICDHEYHNTHSERPGDLYAGNPGDDPTSTRYAHSSHRRPASVSKLGHTDQQIRPDSESLVLFPVAKPDVPMHEKVQNPLLAEAFPSIFPSSGKEFRKCTFAALNMNQSNTKRAMYMRKEASWRRMLVQQPPILDFGLLRKVHCWVGDRARLIKNHVSIYFHYLRL